MTTAADARPNLVPGEYRGVAVADVPCPLDERSLTEHLLGREAYRRTRFVVARHRGAVAVVAVDKREADPLFSPITAVRVLAGPADSAYLHRPEVDTAVPSQLARAAVRDAPGARAVVVEGRYGHVSFIVDPAPLRVTVREVVPPLPAKLADQAARVVDVAEDLPPLELVPEVADLAALAATRPAEHYLLPCRGGGVAVDGAATWYLDERPEQRPWVLVGCERSQQIHAWCYGDRAEQVDLCPRGAGSPAVGPVLTKCCLLEYDVAEDDGTVVVPWGATLAQVRDALGRIAARWEPAWRPA